MSTPHPLPPKKDVALALLQGPSLFIHLDPRKPEVVVPTYFKKQPQLVLQVGLNMAIPIPDLKVDDDGVSCTLSFNRRPFWCRLPWSAIYALVGEDMKGMIWPDEVPSEVAAQREGKQQPAPVGSVSSRARPSRELKRKIAAEAPPDEAKPQAAESIERAAEGAPRPAAAPSAKSDGGKSGKRELPPYLRVVK
jgi:stringent starvation protein B